jgi:hypothetical protein
MPSPFEREVIATYRKLREKHGIRESIKLTAEQLKTDPRTVGLLLGFSNQFLKLIERKV